ncbi:uncharacterized protein LOC123192193 isoform X2 [Mangifera indica]|uniref:uncharacterized protein LOC123192193 isoform X2 n=1 Tax=Mangifera indica TaxID=29780 RepID=UPI001CF9DFDF|nr:uncharacterized protein LOC123192193 isoform X2 [Mangifera indica]
MLQALCKSFQNMQLNFSPFRYSQFIISFYQAAKGDSLMPRTTTCASWDHNSPVLMSKPTNNRIVIWGFKEAHYQNYSWDYWRISCSFWSSLFFLCKAKHKGYWRGVFVDVAVFLFSIWLKFLEHLCMA